MTKQTCDILECDVNTYIPGGSNTPLIWSIIFKGIINDLQEAIYSIYTKYCSEIDAQIDIGGHRESRSHGHTSIFKPLSTIGKKYSSNLY